MLTNGGGSGIVTTVDAGIAHLVERHLAKVEVASSSLVARSKLTGHSKEWPVFYFPNNLRIFGKMPVGANCQGVQ